MMYYNNFCAIFKTSVLSNKHRQICDACRYAQGYTRCDGVLPSPVGRLVWDQEVAGSNPVTPIRYVLVAYRLRREMRPVNMQM